jgi:nitrate/TMAO reductase-like tetraheme cytochrome c subunit
MNKTARAKLFAVVCFVSLVVASAIHAKQPDQAQQRVAAQQQPAASQAKPGDQAKPETLQILKGMSRPDILQTMRGFAAALGVECNFCHVRPFESETPRKSVARLMMRDYTMGMKHKDGAAVSCNDCHKGQPNPLRTRPFDGAVGKQLDGRRVLKGMPEERLMQVMTAFTKALGVDCNYCHTADFDEDTPRKQIARFMMTEFSQGLVKKDGGPVNCTECHQGNAKPLAVLPFPKPPEHKPEPQPAKKPNG